MRKRDKDRIIKDLDEIIHDIQNKFAGQLSAAIWYIENGADLKGFSFAYSASSWGPVLGKRIKTYLDKETKKWDNERLRKRSSSKTGKSRKEAGAQGRMVSRSIRASNS